MKSKASGRGGCLSTRSSWVLILATSVLAFLIVNKAWVCDDAYISFRTVDNLVNGYGLTWNVSERVQAYTNPLWVFIHVPFYLLTKEIFLTTLAISLALSLGAFVVAARSLEARPVLLLTTLLLPLALSKSFIEYSTSGLENPLTMFLLAVFWAELVRSDGGPSSAFRLALIAGLAATNRLDTLLFYIPALGLVASRSLGLRSLLRVAAGFLPLAVWESFSLFYYGFLFPNTKYAKLSTGIASADYAKQGLVYWLDLVKYDPASALLMIGGLAVTLSAVHTLWRRRGRSADPGESASIALVGAGSFLYCLYVVAVGGDFMGGRFWSGPVFLSVLLLAKHLNRKRRYRNELSYLVGVLLAVVFVAFTSKVSPGGIKPTGVTDERMFYVRTNTLASRYRGVGVREHSFSKQGMELRASYRARENPSLRPLRVVSAVGMYGFYSGPDTIIVDSMGLSDPLLARLPVFDPKDWAPGHYIREIPTGYAEARLTGSLQGMDGDLARYYRELRYITAGPLFEWERIEKIAAFNTGAFDHLLKSYLEYKSSGAYPFDSVRSPKRDGTAWDARGNVVIPTRKEVSFVSTGPIRATRVEVSAGGDDEYRLSFFLGSRKLGELAVPVASKASEGLRTRVLSLPEGVRNAPFDRITVRPVTRGPWDRFLLEGLLGQYSVGHIIFS